MRAVLQSGRVLGACVAFLNMGAAVNVFVVASAFSVDGSAHALFYAHQQRGRPGLP